MLILKILKICSSTYNQGPSPPAIALTHLTDLPFTQTQVKDRLQELVQLCFINKNGSI
jgi:hypothetical protein